MSAASVGSESVGGSGHYQSPLAFREHRLRAKLRYFFMNPCEKYNVKRRFPWKLVMQLLKIVLVTIQLAMFGASRSKHVFFLEKSNLAFKHIYLEKWDPSFETMPYPPATGEYALYTIPDFFNHVDYALRRYNETEKLAIGTYHFDDKGDNKPPVVMCKTRYKEGTIFAFNQSYIFDSHEVTECFELHPIEVENATTGMTEEKYDTREYLKISNNSINFDRVIKIELKFALKTVHLKTLTKLYSPDCYRINITITYDNSGHNGQMPVDLVSDVTALPCRGSIIFDTEGDKGIVGFYVAYDSVIIVLSLFSLILCIRSIYKAQILRKETVKFFKETYYKDLSVSDKLEFINFWYVMIIINDLVTMIGSSLKIQIESQRSHHYEICGVLLGTGNLMVWFGVLRYLKFFETYNILILTMRKATPNVLRFLVCAGVFYFGFTVCGWIVLGPYHIKFRTLSSSSETLFSLLNGDDMYVTFQAVRPNKLGTYMWWYTKAYIYIAVAFFTYIVLNLFIGVILDAYETIKHYYEHGFPKTELHDFIDKSPDDDLFSGIPTLDGNCLGNACTRLFGALLNCCYTPRKRTVSVTSRDSILQEGHYQRMNSSETDDLLQ